MHKTTSGRHAYAGSPLRHFNGSYGFELQTFYPEIYFTQSNSYSIDVKVTFLIADKKAEPVKKFLRWKQNRYSIWINNTDHPHAYRDIYRDLMQVYVVSPGRFGDREWITNFEMTVLL